MTKPQNIEAIEEATHKAWEEWVQALDQKGARELDHKDIVERVLTELPDDMESPGWWAQGVTVAYEQHIGRRAPGQRADGTFETNVSKTYDSEREKVFAECLETLANVAQFDGKKVENVRTSVTPKRSYWRCDVEGEGKLTWTVEQKSAGKVLLTISHAQLSTPEEVAHWRDFWKSYMKKL